MIVKVEEDDHGHATLLVHGEPEIIGEVAKAVVLLLAADAEQILFPSFDEGEDEESEEDLASSS